MDTDKIKEGVERPYPKQPQPSDQIDPEKFKKTMRVGGSQEAEDRNKRTFSRKEEEEEVKAEESSPSPETSFSEHMESADPSTSIFDKQSGGIRKETVDRAPPSSPETSFSEHMQSADPSTSIFDKQSEGIRKETVDRPPPSSPETSLSEPMESADSSTSIFDKQSGDVGKEIVDKAPSPSSSEPMESADSSTSIFDKQSGDIGKETVDTPPPSKKKRAKTNNPPPTDSSLLASQPKTKNLEALKRKKKKDPNGEVQIVSQKTSKKKDSSVENQTPPEKLPEIEIKNGRPDPNDTKEKKLEDVKEKQRENEKFFERLSPEEIRNQKIKTQTIHTTEMGAETSLFPEGIPPNQGEKKKGQKEDAFLEANREVAGIPLPSPPPISSPIPPIVDPPVYTKLSPELFELFEKISACLIIQQEKGDTTTTLNLSMPQSVFNKTQIIINQYSTAPRAYNIQLIGNPKSVQIFRDNLEMLEQSFKQGNFAFDVQILNPILATEKKPSHLIRRKGEAGKEQEKKQQ